VDYAPNIAENEQIGFGVIMGDVAQLGTNEEYLRDIAALDKTGKPYYVLPGNHDDQNREAFEKYFGKGYQYFEYGNNLFILLDSTIEDDGIGETQRGMIKTALAQHKGVDNIFVFTHELIWWDRNDPRFNTFGPNSLDAYTEEMPYAFKNELLPLFAGTDAKLHFIAGGSGAFDNGNEIFYGEYDGITYIATGLGSNTKDNILAIDLIKPHNAVQYRLIALNGDNPYALGPIENYARLPEDE
jgi:3',5'-cyclic AMP phosphodiesterase CpdA